MSTTTPNMNLVVPTVGGDYSPNYALEINQSFSTIDQHNHTPGSGVQLTPASLNINSSLTFNNNSATNLASLTLLEQSTPPTGNGIIYESSAGDIHFVNGSGLDIQITNSSGINVTPTSIPGLVSPASVEYVPSSETFIWESNTNIAANMDFGSAIMRNLSPNSTYALTLQPPSGLASNQTLTLPSPVSFTSFVVLDSSGLLAGTINVTNGITTNNISLTAGITGSQLSSSANILGTQLSSSANILGTQLSASAGILGTQLSSSAAIKPSQLGSATTSSVNISSFVTSATTYQVAGTVTIQAVGRPVDIIFQSPSGTLGGGVLKASGTAAPTIYYEVSNATQGVVVSSGQIQMNAVASGFDIIIPPTSLNCIDVNAVANTQTYTLSVAASSGCTVTIANVIMTAIVR